MKRQSWGGEGGRGEKNPTDSMTHCFTVKRARERERKRKKEEHPRERKKNIALYNNNKKKPSMLRKLRGRGVCLWTVCGNDGAFWGVFQSVTKSNVFYTLFDQLGVILLNTLGIWEWSSQWRSKYAWTTEVCENTTPSLVHPLCHAIVHLMIDMYTDNWYVTELDI